jgi:hypothetical protein
LKEGLIKKMKIVGLCSSYDDIKDMENIIKIFIVEQHIRSISPLEKHTIKTMNLKRTSLHQKNIAERINKYMILTVRGIS